MKDGLPDFRALLFWPGAIASLLVAIGLVVSRPSLVSSRPAGETTRGWALDAEDSVDARLWQDPLDAVYRVAREKSSETASKADREAGKAGATDEWSAALARSADGQSDVLILPVFVVGDTYPESAELRRRTRYAVVAALGADGFVSEDAQHLRYFRRGKPGGDKAARLPPIVPFERFVRANVAQRDRNDADFDPDLILVVWIDEISLFSSGAHLTSLERAQVVEGLIRELDSSGRKAKWERRRIRLIGPVSSDLLQDLKRPVTALQSRGDPAADAPDVRIVSPWATQGDTKAHDGIDRWMAGDIALCQELREELRRRRAWPAGPSDGNKIVILSEFDTKYGRELASEFTRLANASAGSGSVQPDHVIALTYLRGIDGLAPIETKSSEPPAGSNKSAQEELARLTYASNEPRAEGRSQADYLSRIEHELRATSVRLARDQSEICAIGIFGSDVYDKLLILRALRPSFPGAVFFTTDLDARLVHPAEWPWTHNLVIASAFGLRLDERHQRPTAAFRDSYQTSAFLAVRRALGLVDPTPPAQATSDRATQEKAAAPRLFEISRYGAYDLSASAGEFPHPPGPRSEASLSSSQSLLIAGILLVTLLLVVPAVRPLRTLIGIFWRDLHAPLPRAQRTMRWKVRTFFAWALLLAFLGLIAAAVFDHSNATGEPFIWFGGISVWPTTLLRFAVGVLCIGYIGYIYDQLARIGEQIKQEYFEGQDEEEKRKIPTNPVRHPLLHPQSLLLLPRDPTKPVTPEKLWSEFQGFRMLRLRIPRVAMLVVLWIALFAAVFALGGRPHTPGRGELSIGLALATLWFSLIALLALLFLVFDITRLCDWMIDALFAPSRERWRPELLQREWDEKHHPPADDDLSVVDLALRVRLAADLSRNVDRMIYLPFSAVFMLALTRHPVFDNWDWPAALLIVFAACFLVIAYAGFVLRFAARDGRRRIADEARERINARSRVHTPGSPQLKRLEAALAEIENEKRGALSGITDDPVLRAVLSMTGGFGTIALFEQLTWLT